MFVCKGVEAYFSNYLKIIYIYIEEIPNKKSLKPQMIIEILSFLQLLD